MSGRIPQEFLDELLARADIGEVISARVPIKKAGREYKACCPFHSEKTPSFTVVPDKAFYHCFGCGAHGNALDFLMEFDRLEFPEAVEELADLMGLKVPREESRTETSPTAPVFGVLSRAAEVFTRSLKEQHEAQDYLKQRGISGATAKTFALGYAPPGWDRLIRELGGSDESLQRLLEAGLIVRRDDGKRYDRFRERVMFPIRDARARVVGFGGRIIGQGEPKYLNSPETPVFHKGRELYGLYEARQANRRLERLLVVEGYMDAVVLAEHGVTNAVATLGTATTTEHLRRLFRASQEVVFCFDGDRAGRDAAWRALNVSLGQMREGRQIRCLFLPEGHDPDSLIREEGSAAFQSRLLEAVPLSEYLFAHLSAQVDLQSVDGRARLAESALPLLGQLPEGVYRELLTGQLAQKVGLPTEKLERRLSGDSENPRLENSGLRKQPVSRRVAGRPSLIRQAVALLIHYPGAGAGLETPPELAQMERPGLALLRELLKLTRQHPELSPAAVSERFRGRPEHKHLEALLAQEMLVEATEAPAQIQGSLDRLALEECRRRLDGLVARSAAGLSEPEKEEFQALQNRIREAGDYVNPAN